MCYWLEEAVEQRCTFRLHSLFQLEFCLDSNIITFGAAADVSEGIAVITVYNRTLQ